MPRRAGGRSLDAPRVGSVPVGALLRGAFVGAALLAGAPPAAGQCGQVLVGETTSLQDGFASSFDVDGGWAVVAAPRDDGLWNDAGAAWILREQGGAWAVDAKLVPNQLAPGAFYSHAQVAIDYPWAFAGSLWEPAPGGGDDRGVVRVYRHDPHDGDWDLEQRLWLEDAGPSTGFGSAVEFDDGALFVAARERQEVWVYRLDPEPGDPTDGDWEPAQVLTDPEPGVGGDWLGLAIAADHGAFATASVRPGAGLVAYRFESSLAGPNGAHLGLAERVGFGGAAVKAGRVALGLDDLAVQGFLTATGESSKVHVYHPSDAGPAEHVELVGPTGSTAEFGRALAFDDHDELLFVGARAFAGSIGPLGLGRTMRRASDGWLVESEFRAVPSYPQLRFATGARFVDGRLFVATQDDWQTGISVSGRLYAFEGLTAPSLAADRAELSLAAGGEQRLDLQACPEQAGQGYIVAGSLGRLPIGSQLALGAHSLALQFDLWTELSLDGPNQAPFLDTFGLLDAAGHAAPRIALPPGSDPALSGLELHHQAILFDPSTGGVTGTTIPVGLRLVP